MKEYSVNTLYLAQISELGLLKQFAQWITYKSYLNKGCCYNYTDVHFARKVGISTSKARSLRLFWIEQGWCRFEKGRIGNKLIFNSARNSVRGDKWHRTTVTIFKDVKQTINQLYYQIIENKGKKQFEFLKRIAVAISKPSNYKEHKWAKNKLKKLGSDRLPKTDARFKISYKGLGNTFGCSSSKAHSLIKEFTKQGKITVIQQAQQIFGSDDKSKRNFAVKFIPNGFTSRNYVYKALCNEYVFS